MVERIFVLRIQEEVVESFDRISIKVLQKRVNLRKLRPIEIQGITNIQTLICWFIGPLLDFENFV